MAESDLAKPDCTKKYEGNTISSNCNPSQILEHTAKLVFPSGTHSKIITGKEARDYSLDIINLSKEKLKTFVLSFEPTFAHKKEPYDSEGGNESKELEILNALNPERRVYAICV